MSKQPNKGKKPRADEKEAATRLPPPPPSGLPVMPRPFEVNDIRDDGGTFVNVEATPAERAALAQAYDLQDVASLTARFNLVRRGKTVAVTGDVKARITQVCVVTVEAFESDVDEPVDLTYAPEAQVAEAWERIAKAEASGTNAPVEDPPDVIVDGRIDLGLLTAETLSLSLDPYPKKPGVEFEAPEATEDDVDESPFAMLAKLKKDIGPGGA
ncbi:MAG: hypothetical protein JWN07_3402 [Hyphomicrobiales bacterium]|nr:hypothetical protein [Hyphomicrobiales bacterium]